MLAKFPLRYAFFLSFGSLLLLPSLIPNLHIAFLIPYLVIAVYRRPISGALNHAFFAGLIADLFSTSSLFGLYSLSFCLTTLVLYRFRSVFFEDKLLTLPLMTSLFSGLHTVLLLFLLKFLGHSITLLPKWFFTDLVLMPLADALFALTVFSLPFQFYLFASKLIGRGRFHASFRRRTRRHN